MEKQKIIHMYETLTQSSFHIREINTLGENTERKDHTYEKLIFHAYHYPLNQKRKLLVLIPLLETLSPDISAISKCSYLYGINYNWNKALETMEKVILLEKGKNLDSWVDYGLFLRKIPEYEDISIRMLLDIEYVMEQYRGEDSLNTFLKNLYCESAIA